MFNLIIRKGTDDRAGIATVKPAQAREDGKDEWFKAKATIIVLSGSRS